MGFSRGIFNFVFSALLIPFSALSAPLEAQFCDLAKEMDAIEPDARMRQALMAAYLADKQIVYVSGYFHVNEEFGDNKSAFREIEPLAPVGKIIPPPKQSVEANVSFLLTQLRDFGTRNPGKKILLIGQSKGGAEVLHLAGSHPAIFAANSTYGFHIADVVTLNAAIGGSPLADITLNRDPALTAKWEAYVRENGLQPDWISDLLKQHLNADSAGFKSLASREARARNTQLLAGMDELVHTILARKFWYVTTRRSPDAKDMPFYLEFSAKFMALHMDPNDGLVEEKMQLLPAVGTHMMALRNAGHMSLIGPQDRSDCRKEFTKLLVLMLARENRPSTAR